MFFKVLLRKKCPNTGKYGPEKVYIWSLFTECHFHSSHLSVLWNVVIMYGCTNYKFPFFV